jgi:hypothetical protein
VFYDEYELVELWGKDLQEQLDRIYREDSQMCVLFISEAYSRKMWTSHERKSALARAMAEDTEYVLPARFDGTELPGLRPTIGFIDIKDMAPQDLAKLIRRKIGNRDPEYRFPEEPVRMWTQLEISDDDISGRERTQRVAYDFVQVLGKMSHKERVAVCGVLAFGCPGELPELVHISLDLLARDTGMKSEELLRHLGNVRALNVKASIRDSLHVPDEGEIMPDDKDVALSYWSLSERDAGDSTQIIYAAVQSAVDHYCEEHGLEAVVRRDFSRLGTEG